MRKSRAIRSASARCFGAEFSFIALQRRKIEARTESVARAGQHKHTALARSGFFQRGNQLQLHFRRHRIAPLGPIAA